MSENFSGIVRITNASDYIAPSQACILPLRKPEAGVDSKVRIRKKGEALDDSGGVKKRVTVSLNDCLACNGCVTTAESILVQEQSTTKFTDGLATHSVSVVTVSPQSLCSIAVKRCWSVSHAAKLVASKLKSLGATYVVDSSFGRYFSLAASYEEFKENQPRKLLLASACPGFVCYAEKVHGKLLLPYMSRVRSPQAIMGSLVKDFLSRSKSLQPENIFYASIMPCFDKKLEASRPDFNSGFAQVDCVISTAEADLLLDDDSVPSCSSCNMDIARADWLESFPAGIVIGTPGGPSGGYAEYIVRRYLNENGLGEDNLRVTKKQKDLEVIEVLDNDKVLLTVAKCYGFRNIQNMVQKVKRGKCAYDYVEVMACPSGCANGGGQIRGETNDTRSSILESVIEKYNSLQPAVALEVSVMRVKEEWQRLNKDWKSWIFTDFHVVDKNITQSQNIRW